MPSTSTLPDRLYKYESLSVQSLQNLKAQSIYFGSPTNFNDPYDCAISPIIKPLSDKELNTLRELFLQDPVLPDNVRHALTKMPLELFRDQLMKSGEEAFRRNKSRFLSTRGVACFSERNDDLLMWSHYAGKYKGFCLEFDTSRLQFDKILKVNYSNALPTVNLIPLLDDADVDASEVLSIFTTKAIAWSYEAEWRAIHQAAGTLYGYPPESLTGVFFGPEIERGALEIICLILQGQNQTVRFWKGQRSTVAFKVDFEKFTYTSFRESQFE